VERVAQTANEEFCLAQIKSLVQQYKTFLEDFRADSQEVPAQSELNEQISYYDDFLKLIERHLKTLKRRQRRQRLVSFFKRSLIQSIVFLFKPQNSKQLILLGAILLCFSTVYLHFFRTVGQSAQTQTEIEAQPPQPLGFVDPKPLPTITKGDDKIKATSQSTLGSFTKRVVGNTGGVGVRYRSEPLHEAASDFVLEEGKQIILISKQLDAADQVWWKVRLPEGGKEGYILDKYLLK
jgi:hypothetical protein